MTETLRSILHPGARHAERTPHAPCTISRQTITLPAGLPFDEAVFRGLAEAGSESAYVKLRDVPVRPLRYVIPAASPDAAHTAWYSETFAPEGEAVVEEAGLFVGRREGGPFLHCHGIFRTEAGRVMGHIKPSETVLAADAIADALCIHGAMLNVRQDTETNFPLFHPVPTPSSETTDGVRGVLAAVRPNEDIAAALDALCRRSGFGQARIHGIGSLVGADFAGGAHLSSYATEVLVRAGEYGGGDAQLDIALVDLDGRLSEGQLAGPNPVCVTFEVLIEELR